MKTIYHYVVLRLAPDGLRGEVINVGIVLFNSGAAPRVVVMATLNKLRALDVTWDAARLSKWAANIDALVQASSNPEKVIDSLGRFGFCDPKGVGMFMADSDAEVASHLADIRATYVGNKAAAERPAREKRTRLQTALRQQFKRMHVLGEAIDDVANHLVVPNVPVPDYPELKSDFLYKNGVYRVTQAIDYRVAPDSLHNKLAEACVKSTAAELALKAYGSDTLRLAVLDIPDEFRDATDTHVDLLVNQGFQIFHFGEPQSLAEYFSQAAPAIGQ